MAIFLTILLSASAADPVHQALMPYHVECRVSASASPSLPEALQADVIAAVSRTARQVFGDAWQLSITRAGDNASSDDAADKRFEVHLSADSRSGYVVRCREFDRRLEEWSPWTTTVVPRGASLGQGTWRAIRRSFRPVAWIGSKVRGEAEIRYLGSALMSRASEEALMESGRPMLIVRRLVEPTDDQPAVSVVPWSYLVHRLPKSASDGSLTERALIESAFRDPITRRSRQKFDLWAVACPHLPDGQTTLTFIDRQDDERPIVGYEVVIRPIGQNTTLSMGTTDFRGQITIHPHRPVSGRQADNTLVEVQLVSGRSILAQFPLVPGAPADLEVKAPVDPLLPEISGDIIALQESVVDLAARRKVLEIRLRKAAGEERIDLAKEIAEQLNELPNRAQVAEKLEAIRQRAEARRAELDQAQLSRSITRLFLQTEHLLQSVPQDKVVIELVNEPAEGG